MNRQSVFAFVRLKLLTSSYSSTNGLCACQEHSHVNRNATLTSETQRISGRS